ncbi:MAG: hypothetical protein GW949_03070 [Spirochaetales bacterium]|nr:hypothetical protein [Spirochaetales bacterium]
MKSYLPTALILLLILIFSASCSYGPTGIFAGIEVERKIVEIDTGLPGNTVQRLVTDGTNAVLSNGQIFKRDTLPAVTWKKIDPPSGYIGSVDVGMNATDIFTVFYNASGTGAYSRAVGGTSWSEVTLAAGYEAQGVLTAGSTVYFVAREDDGQWAVLSNVGVLVPNFGNLESFPVSAIDTGSGILVLTKTKIHLSTDPINTVLEIADRDFYGISNSGTDVFLTTNEGYIYQTDNTLAAPTLIGSQIQIDSTPVPLRGIYAVDNNTLYVGTEGKGYYKVTDASTTPVITRATTRTLSNLLDTSVYASTVSGFAAAPSGLYMMAPGNGLWYGNTTNAYIEWQALTPQD